MPEGTLEDPRPPSKGIGLGAWTGVGIDVALTLLLVVVGIDPVFAVVEAFKPEAALTVCATHIVVVTLAIITGAARSEELDLLNARTRMGKVFEVAYLMFIVLGIPRRDRGVPAPGPEQPAEPRRAGAAYLAYVVPADAAAPRQAHRVEGAGALYIRALEHAPSPAPPARELRLTAPDRPWQTAPAA
jgi:hypothetical protein